jgi:hypothetical protein
MTTFGIRHPLPVLECSKEISYKSCEYPPLESMRIDINTQAADAFVY